MFYAASRCRYILTATLHLMPRVPMEHPCYSRTAPSLGPEKSSAGATAHVLSPKYRVSRLFRTHCKS
eukprot:2527584-Amphidinium_carterae.1